MSFENLDACIQAAMQKHNPPPLNTIYLRGPLFSLTSPTGKCYETIRDQEVLRGINPLSKGPAAISGPLGTMFYFLPRHST